jgi:hypothetical protein
VISPFDASRLRALSSSCAPLGVCLLTITRPLVKLYVAKRSRSHGTSGRPLNHLTLERPLMRYVSANELQSSGMPRGLFYWHLVLVLNGAFACMSESCRHRRFAEEVYARIFFRSGRHSDSDFVRARKDHCRFTNVAISGWSPSLLYVQLKLYPFIVGIQIEPTLHPIQENSSCIGVWPMKDAAASSPPIRSWSPWTLRRAYEEHISTVQNKSSCCPVVANRGQWSLKCM